MAYYEDVIDVNSTTVQQPFTRELVGFLPGYAHLTVETQNVRYFYSGQTPATDNGHIIYANDSAIFDKASDITNIKLIAETGTARITVTLKGP